MKLLMLTWTDIFYGIAEFFGWIFEGMKWLAHAPNFLFGTLVIFGIVYWTLRLQRYHRETRRNSTIE